jgi:hypothetical protein
MYNETNDNAVIWRHYESREITLQYKAMTKQLLLQEINFSFGITKITVFNKSIAWI